MLQGWGSFFAAMAQQFLAAVMVMINACVTYTLGFRWLEPHSASSCVLV